MSLAIKKILAEYAQAMNDEEHSYARRLLEPDVIGACCEQWVRRESDSATYFPATVWISRRDYERLAALPEWAITFGDDAPYVNPDPNNDATRADALVRIGLSAVEEHLRRGDESLRAVVGPGTTEEEGFARWWAHLPDEQKDNMEELTKAQRKAFDAAADAILLRRLETINRRD